MSDHINVLYINVLYIKVNFQSQLKSLKFVKLHVVKVVTWYIFYDSRLHLGLEI